MIDTLFGGLLGLMVGAYLAYLYYRYFKKCEYNGDCYMCSEEYAEERWAARKKEPQGELPKWIKDFDPDKHTPTDFSTLGQMFKENTK